MLRAGLPDLAAVVAVATHKSFRAAARELGLSPSATSHAISTLEQRIGVRLFNRTTRSVSLSEAGERFLSRVRPALREISDALAAADEAADTPRGTVRINTSEGAARDFLMPVVLEFIHRFPDMRVDLVTDDALVDIVEGGFDLGVRGVEAVPKDMVAVPCGPDVRFAIVGTPRYFRGRTLPKVPGDLSAHECIRRRWPSGTVYRWELERRGREVAVDVQGRLTLDRDLLVLEAVRKSVGLAYVTEWSVARDIASGRLIRVLEDWTPSMPGLRLYYPTSRLMPQGMRAFVDLVREMHARGQIGPRPAHRT